MWVAICYGKCYLNTSKNVRLRSLYITWNVSLELFQTQKIADRICETSREVVAIGKATFYAQMNLERKEAYRYIS